MEWKDIAKKIMIDNAEEPEDIQDGIGTFTTFRVEYVINDIVKALDSAYLRGKKDEREKNVKDYRVVDC